MSPSAESMRASRSSFPGPLRRILSGALVLLLVAGAGLLFLGRRGGPRLVDPADVLHPGAASGFNVVLVTLDTVRADHLGSYGDTQAETPNIDSLLEHGIRFDDAITPVPITLPSHCTMMTGLYPPRHGVRDNGIFRLGADHPTLAERLKQHGYRTAAFVGCFVLDRRFGLARGFDTYDFEVDEKGYFPSNFDFNQRSAGAVTDAAIRWLGQRETASAAPFLLWVHYFDAHVPYQSPLGQDPRFAGRPYDAEIAYVDREFGRLLAELDRRDLRERTLVVVVSDPGEGLREHDESTHGLFVYESTLRVAFLLSSPGLFRGAAHVGDRTASLVDLRPTLEDLLGLPPDGEVDGVSFARKATSTDRSLYIETKMPFYAARCSPLAGIRRAHEKYIHAPVPEYYDLAADPAERTNLYASRRERVDALAADLDELRKRWPETEAAAAAREMTGEEAERLRSLGYVHSTGGAAPESLPDVKAMMSASAKLTAALRLQRENRLDEALRTAREASLECKGYLDAAALVSQLCQRLGRTDEAIQVLRDQVDINPTAAAALQLAQVYLMNRQYDAMEGALGIAARLEPDNGFVHVMRGDRYSAEGRRSDAIREYETALQVDPYRVGMIVRPVLDRLRAQAGDSSSPSNAR